MKTRSKYLLEILVMRIFQKNLRIEQIEVGTEKDSWPLPSNLPKSGVALLVGVGEDVHLEEYLIGLGWICYCMDPTPRAIEYFKRKFDCNLSISLIEKGLSDRVGHAKFYFPQNPDHVSLSAVNLQSTDKYIELEITNLIHVLQDLELESFDLVKLDIEGLSVRVINDMLKMELRPRYLLVDFEYPTGIFNLLRVNVLLKKHGYELVSRIKRECLYIHSEIDS
jgi:FkbM family methyltransferase